MGVYRGAAVLGLLAGSWVIAVTIALIGQSSRRRIILSDLERHPLQLNSTPS